MQVRDASIFYFCIANGDFVIELQCRTIIAGLRLASDSPQSQGG